MRLIFLFVFSASSLFSIENNAIKDSVEAIFKNQFSGQLCIVKSDSLVLNYFTGLSDRNWNTKINDSTLFDIGHVSQIFIHKFFNNMENDGQNNILKSKFVDYFPDFPYPEITVLNLLEHSSGLTNNYIKLYHRIVFQNQNIKMIDKSKRISNIDILLALETTNIPLSFIPGSKFEFNSLNYLLLSSLIEQITHKNFSDLAKNNPHFPLLINANTDTIIGKANAYQFTHSICSPFDNLNHIGLEYTDGTIGNQHFFSNSKDLTNWGVAELKTTFKSIKNPVPESGFYKGYFYDKTHQAFISRGEFGGNSTYLIIQPEKKIVISITSNERGLVNFKQSIDELLRILSLLLP